MSDYPEAKARDKATLEQQIMDSCIAKNDAEWWAMKEIEKLRAAIADTNAALQHAQYPKVQEALRIIRKALAKEGK